MPRQKFFIITIFLQFILLNSYAQEKLMWGGGIGAVVPDNGFGKIVSKKNPTIEDFGFATVANPGINLNVGTLWMFNPRLSLLSELAYSYFPKDKKTWNPQQYGDIKVNYQMVNLSAQGNYYFSEQEIKPYLGAIFGLYYLRNYRDFNSSYASNESVSITTNTLHAGYGAEFGFLFELSKVNYLQVGIRFSLIPDIEAEYIPEKDITINPHDKQNHWGLSAKLFFK